MEGNRTIMSSMTIPLCTVLIAALTAAPVLAQSQPSKAPASSQEAARPAGTTRATEGPASTAPAAPKSDLVQDKFRKFQKEMSRTDAAPGTRGAAAAADPAATGAASAAEASEKAPESISVFSLGFQILLGLAFVLILAVVSIRLLKKFQGRLFARSGPSGGGDILEVLESCHLGTNQRVIAMRINDEVGVLGVTPQGITLLTVLKQPADELIKQRAGNSAAFSDNLNKLLDRFKKPKRVSDLLDEA